MKDLEMNPYVIQIDKFVNSLEKLSKVFLDLEEKKTYFSEEELKGMCQKVCDKVCQVCGNREICLGRERMNTYGLIWDIFRAVENYGTELNVEVKRKVQKNCVQAPKFVRNALEIYKNEKQTMLWNQKMAQSREGCAIQLDSFAQMIQHATRELDASIFADEHLEKKIRSRFTKLGMKILTTVFLVTEDGRYEIHVTTKAQKGDCITTKELAQIISECCGRNMVLGKEERAVLGSEYCTITCVEGPRYHTLQGVAKIGKGCRKVSGDSFSMLDLPGGKQGVILSDGMGAGEIAYRESTMVVELLEELLDAGFPKETALQMLNTALVIGREEVRFSTIDMSVFDLYNGKCEIVKAGASMTFIKREDKVECIKSTSLPIGVVPKLEVDEEVCKLSDGDIVIMVTDGVMDALPTGEQEFLMRMIIEGTQKTNPKEIAQHILEQVLECSGEVPMDDMTVLAVGIWSLEK
ncbi:MAG: SpoIIE family protein phosphatase [Tyzzerella sp.]|nr:SpoIIE family protein phosphatase [Tyzzerella sp.]